MAKIKDKESADEIKVDIKITNDAPPPVLAPVQNLLIPERVVSTQLHADLTMTQRPAFQAFAGEFHLVELDSEGNEKAGTDFSIGENTFYKAFAHITSTADNIVAGSKFLLKKKNPNNN